jgi:hypothetical protein
MPRWLLAVVTLLELIYFVVVLLTVVHFVLYVLLCNYKLQC